MADDLSAPLGRKRASAPRASKRPEREGKRQLTDLPLARIAFGVAALVIVGVTARILFVNDPMGGRPVAQIDVSGTQNVNAVATNVAPSMATITADPETPAAPQPGVTIVGDDVPDGIPTGFSVEDANADGLFPELLEDTEHGPIPRIADSGQRPFEAYAQPSLTPANAGGKKLVAIVVTGLGLNKASTAAAIDTLPEGVTLAFAPYGDDLNRVVASARSAGHEVLLEVPLEPFDYPESDPGPDTLLTGQAPRDNLQKLFTVMGKFGGYVGLINHMGARFTSSTADFAPVMEELGSRGLGYLDDGSSNRSVASQLASANRVAFGLADITLDMVPSRQAILSQLKALETRANDTGIAIAVISALPISVQTLAEWAETAEEQGIELVPVSALMKSDA
jgi:polysaccharide deacetylase 2 family uncharacterized protein YibQ